MHLTAATAKDPLFNIHSAVACLVTAPAATSDYDEHHREAREFYRHVLVTLGQAGVPFLVGGAYAFARFTGIKRPTKDFDIFLRASHLERGLDALTAAGFTAEATFPHWLAKAASGPHFMDIIFGSGNGVAPVDDEWFENAVGGEVFALPVLLCPAEEMLWSKAFVMERERYDGADVIHLLHARGPHLDWQRMMRRFGDHWRVLFANLVLYGFIYPGDPAPAPSWVTDELRGRLDDETALPPTRERLCRGTLLSREQYLVDTLERGYADARQIPHGSMTATEIARWTEAIDSGR